MLRQPSSRHQNAKAFQAKHIIKVLLFTTASIWLFYEINHSHYKKVIKEMDGIPNRSEYRSLEALKLGRKDLVSGMAKTIANSEFQDMVRYEVEEEEPGIFIEETDEEDERKLDEDEIDVLDKGRAEESSEKEVADTVEGVSKDSIHSRTLWDEIDIQDTEQDLEKFLGENIVSEGMGDESEVWVNHDDDQNNAEMHLHGTWEEHYKADDPSNTIVPHPEKVDEKQMEEIEAKLDIFPNDRTDNDTGAINGADESALQEDGVNLSVGHAVSIKAPEKNEEVGHSSTLDSTTDELEENNQEVSNITTESPVESAVEMCSKLSSVADVESSNFALQNSAPEMGSKIDQNVTSIVESAVEGNSNPWYIVAEEAKKTEESREDELEDMLLTMNNQTTVTMEEDGSVVNHYARMNEEKADGQLHPRTL